MSTAQKLFIHLTGDNNEVDLTHWTRFCRANNLSSGAFTMAFVKAVGGSAKRLTEAQFNIALADLAARESTPLDSFISKLTLPKQPSAKRAPLRGPVRFFYDKRTYTGIHKSEISSTEISIHDLSELCDRSQCDARGRKISAPPAPGFATHEDIKTRKLGNSTPRSLPTTPRRNAAASPAAALPAVEPAEEEREQQPPVPTVQFEDSGDQTSKENKDQPLPQTNKEIELFSNIPTFSYTPVWPSARQN